MKKKQCLIKTLNLMQVNTKFLVCSLIYMGSLSANAVGSSSLANETVHVSILSVDQTKNERNITGRIIDGDTGEALIGVSILVKGSTNSIIPKSRAAPIAIIM